LEGVGSRVNLSCALVGNSVSVSSCEVLDLTSLATSHASTSAGDVPCRPLSLNRGEISGSGDRSLVRIFFGPTRIHCPSTCHTEHVPIADAI
jgi:hypothetical protein